VTPTAPAAPLCHCISLTAVVLGYVSLVLIRVKPSDIFSAIEATPIKSSTNDSGEGVQQDQPGQDPEDPREEYEQDIAE